MVIMGLCKNRHEMPEEVKDFIFDEILDPMDFKSMRKHVANVLAEKLNIRIGYSIGLASADDEESICYYGEGLKLYVTGLTSAAMEVVRFCAHYGCCLVLMHYDRESG